MKPVSLCCAMALLLSSTSLADVYKWRDENGRIQYGDRPPATRKAEVLEIKPGDGTQGDPAKQTSEVLRNRNRDTFVMPFLQAKESYTFVMTSAEKNGQPVDNLSAIAIDGEQPSILLFTKVMGTKRNKPYDFRIRILDADGVLAFDNTATYTSPTRSISFRAISTPVRNVDAPGVWTFQGILDGKRLFVERREVKIKRMATN